MKYLKTFKTHGEYNTYIHQDDKNLPNVIYCLDNREVHYNPLEFAIVATFKVKSSNNIGPLPGGGGIILDPSLLENTIETHIGWFDKTIVKKLIIDDEEVSMDDVITEDGCIVNLTANVIPVTHIIKYILVDPTVVPESMFDSTSKLTDIILPETITEIGPYAFLDSGLLSITLPEGLQSIYEGAFSGCNSLESIIFPNSLKFIGNEAFASTGFTEITIPTSVEEIEGTPFAGCIYLSDVTINSPAIVNKYYEYGDNIGTIFGELVINYTIGEGITAIGEYAFLECSLLTSVVLPDSIQDIGQEAFGDCTMLTSINIPGGLRTIGDGAFRDCQTLNINLVIPSGVNEIGVDAFRGCQFNSISVNSNNTTFDSRDNCKAIIETSTNILIKGCKLTTIPATVTRIGHAAFAQILELRTIEISNNITAIDSYAFSECEDLETAIVNRSTPPSLGMDAFTDCTNENFAIYVPNNKVSTYKSAFGWSTYASYIESMSDLLL